MPEVHQREHRRPAEGPPPIDDKIASRDVLGALLKTPLGHVTFSEGDLHLRDESRRSGRQLFHNGKYFHKRLAEYPDRPVNAKCQERVQTLLREALSGRMPRYEPQAVSARLVGVMEKASGLDLSAAASACREEDGKPPALLLELLDVLLSLSLDAEFVEVSVLRRRFENVLQGNAAPFFVGGHGVGAFYYSVAEANYPQRISAVSSRLDIAHFHGLTWTNFHREYIRGALGKQGVEVRVTLLDPCSPFFEPYAGFIRIDADLLRAKYREAVEIWKTIYADATSGVLGGSSLKLYANKGFPAKSIYRFDDEIVVTPANNAQPKAQFMAYACSKVAGSEHSAFDIYEKELDWLFGEGARLVWSSDGVQAAHAEESPA